MPVLLLHHPYYFYDFDEINFGFATDSKGTFGKIRKPINKVFQIYKFLLYGC